MPTYKIDVIDEDFELGEMRNSNRCAVKRAVARSIPGATRVEVDLQTIRFSLDGERHVFLTPWQVAEYVIAFDAGDDENLQPFSFRLRPSNEVGSKVRRQEFTEEGKKVDSARNRVRKAKARKAKAIETLASPATTATERARADEVLETVDQTIAAYEEQYAEARETAAASGKPRTRRVDTNLPKAPRKSKTRTRRYGMRELRVNQGEGRVHIVDHQR